VSVFATQFAKISQAAQKAAFETRFNAIQQGMIKRLNKEIAEIADDGTERRIAELQKKRDGLVALIPKIQEYQFGLNTNANRFLEIQEAAETAVTNATGDTTMTAEEAAALNTAKDEIAENIRNLLNLYYPGFDDGQLALRMGQDAESLDALTAVAGTIDAEGTSPTTNDNRPLIDLLGEIQSRASTFQSSTNTLVDATNEMIIDTQKRAFDLEADLTQLTAVEIARKTEEIEELKLKHANLLKAISVSFEVSSGLGDVLANGTQPPPEKGSILNLFI